MGTRTSGTEIYEIVWTSEGEDDEHVDVLVPVLSRKFSKIVILEHNGPRPGFRHRVS